jgi:hypothetical protein
LFLAEGMMMATLGVFLSIGLALAPRESAQVAATRHFVFYSDKSLNLHDRLNHLTRSDSPMEPNPCIDELPKEQQEGWSEALVFYRERLSELHLRGEEMAAVRARMLNGDSTQSGGALVDAIFDHIEKARPAYEACLWTEQDRINRSWIESVVPKVRKHEEALTERLSNLFQYPWPADRISIDVVGWVSRAGANTIDEPAHVMMSSVDDAYRGDAALEMVFHESSHLLIDASYGPVSEEIWRVNAGRMLPRRDLWHTVLFYTVGQATKERLAEAGQPGYVPYLYAQGLIERGWRPYREPLETHWQLYMDGEIELRTAVERMVEAIHQN